MPAAAGTAPADDASIIAAHKRLHDQMLSPAVWREVAEEFMQSGEDLRAAHILRTHLGSDQEDVAAHLLLGRVVVQHGGVDGVPEAVEACRHAVRLVEKQDGVVRAHAACALGVALCAAARASPSSLKDRASHWQEAEEALHLALSTCPVTHPLRPFISYHLALALAEQGKAREGARHAREALSVAQTVLPSAQLADLTAHAVLLVALLLSGQQQPGSAVTTLSALDTPSFRPGDGQALRHHMDVGGRVLAARVHAAVLRAAGDVHGAAEVLAKCRQAAGGEAAAAQAGLAALWQDLAMLFADADAPADAVFCADQALKVQPWSAASLCAAGQAQEASGDLDAAADSYGAALGMDPHHAPALLRLGMLLAKQGGGSLTRLSAAHDLITDALRVEPGWAAGWYQLGLTSRAMKHHALAEQHLRNALQLAATTPALPYSVLPLRFPPPPSALSAHGP